MEKGLALVLLLASCGRIRFANLDATTGDDDATDGTVSARWSKVVAYGNETCGVFAGRAYCWGQNDLGQLGDGSMAKAKAPVAVALPAGAVTDLSEGQDRGCAIVAGDLYCYGALGTPAPTKIALPTAATAVAVGGGFACVLVGTDVYCWGDNGTGQAGVGNTNPRIAPDTRVASGLPAMQISAGDDHACLVDAIGEGHAQCWGHNDNGTLGHGSFAPASSLSPADVTVLTQLPHIAGWHACALKLGAVLCWGEGANGQLGDGNSADKSAPQQVPGLGNVTAVTTGGGPTLHDATCAITFGGGVQCWGNGQEGRLGQGAGDSSTPVSVFGLPGPATGVALGFVHGCALIDDGSLWCWGRGVEGQLGDGAGTSSLAPVRVRDP